MAHRDPETGQFVSDSPEQVRSQPMSWSALEFQQLRGRRSSTGSANESIAIQDTFEALNSDLESFEVAELVYLQRVATGKTDNASETSQTEPGHAEHSIELDINGGEGEWILSDQRSNPDQDDRTGVVDFWEGHSGAQFRDIANTLGGGDQTGAAGTDGYREVNLRHMTGMGPLVDRSDDLDVRIEVSKFSLSRDAQTRYYYNLGWLVHDLEDVRSVIVSQSR